MSRGSTSREPVLAAFDDAFAPEVRVRVGRFLDDLRAAGGYLVRGTGAHPSLSGYLRTAKGVRALWSLTLDPGPLGGPQFFCNVAGWLEAFGQAEVDRILDAFAEEPALAPLAESVRERGAEKLHRVRITDVFGSEAATERVRAAISHAVRLIFGSPGVQSS